MKKIIFLLFLYSITLLSLAQDKKYDEGLKSFDDKNYTKAFKLLKPYADQGDMLAQYVVGRCYSDKELEMFDSALAEEYLLKSSNQKYGRAMGMLAVVYFSNDKKIEASVWAETAACYDPVQKGLTARHVIRKYLSKEELLQVRSILQSKQAEFSKIDLTELDAYISTLEK